MTAVTHMTGHAIVPLYSPVCSIIWWMKWLQLCMPQLHMSIINSWEVFRLGFLMPISFWFVSTPELLLLSTTKAYFSPMPCVQYHSWTKFVTCSIIFRGSVVVLKEDCVSHSVVIALPPAFQSNYRKLCLSAHAWSKDSWILKDLYSLCFAAGQRLGRSHNATSGHSWENNIH